MLFNSVIFLIFFAIVVGVHYLPIGWKLKKIHLLLASYFFYAAWNPPFVLLLWISTCVDWLAARSMSRQKQQAKRKLLLCLSLIANLGMLSWFKYGTLIMETFSGLVSHVGITWAVPDFNITLPVGISFYTFQTLSYTIDVYLKRSEPESSFLDFALFVTFFPQLVAGPIVRPNQLIPQFKTPKQANAQQFSWGIMLFVWGLFQKSVLADSILGPVAGHAFGLAEEMYVMDAWIATLAFSGQIFFDFAGYSLCAIGIALCLGFSLPDNFKSPYAAIGFSDFWRRWHISLSEWLRDYLYIPLGGNRKGRRRTQINLMLTMLLGGLWHGAAWRFVAWGAIHGSYLLLERGAKTLWMRRQDNVGLSPLQQVLVAAFTFLAVSLTWVFFAAPNWESCEITFRSLVGATTQPIAVMENIQIIYILPTLAIMLLGHSYMRNRRLEVVVSHTPILLLLLVFLVVLLSVILTGGGESAFIYFQF